MNLEGRINRTTFSTALASFYVSGKLIARLKEAPRAGFRTGFELKFFDDERSNKESLMEFVLGFAKNRFQIESRAIGFPWYYERKKWYQIFNSTGTLYTNGGKLKISKGNERFELHIDHNHVGTLTHDRSEYRFSFDPKLDLKLCLVASSIFVIENETLIDKTV